MAAQVGRRFSREEHRGEFGGATGKLRVRAMARLRFDSSGGGYGGQGDGI
jgi:hypothetical protein